MTEVFIVQTSTCSNSWKGFASLELAQAYVNSLSMPTKIVPMNVLTWLPKIGGIGKYLHKWIGSIPTMLYGLVINVKGGCPRTFTNLMLFSNKESQDYQYASSQGTPVMIEVEGGTDYQKLWNMQGGQSRRRSKRRSIRRRYGSRSIRRRSIRRRSGRRSMRR
jgi:hypothetical protein